MGVITKNANIVLLFLIVLSAAALVGATVFFQMNFEKINTEYNEKMDQLKLVSADLKTQQAILDTLKSELTVKSAREEQLGEKFTEVRGEKEELETVKQKLERSKEQLESELENTQTILVETRQQLDAKKDTIKSLEEEVDDLEAEFAACEKKRTDAEEDLDDCEDDMAQCTCP